MLRCKNCILPNTYPYINFDENGICNYCNSYRPNKYMGINALNELVDKIKSEKRKYDCLVGLSGGRDSSYLAYKLVKELNMNVLAYSYDNGHMTESARENVKKISEKLDIKTIIIDKDADKNSRIFKRNFLAWAKKPSMGMIPMICIGCKAGILKYQHPLMKKYNIKYLADGGNLSENSYHKLGFLGLNTNDATIFIRTKDDTTESSRADTKFPLISAILRETFRNPYFLNPLIFIEGIKEFREISRKFPKGKSVFKPFIYEKYDDDKVIKVITEELDWKKPSYCRATWRSDCKIAILKNYCYFKTVGFSDYDYMLSNRIWEGLVDRKEAMNRIEEYNNFDTTFIDGFLKSEGIVPSILHNAIKLWQDRTNIKNNA